MSSLPFREALSDRRVPLIVAPLCGLVAGTTLALLSGATSPWVALAILGGLVVAGAVMFNPNLGYMLTVLVIPLERLGRLTDDGATHTVSLMRFVGLLAVAAFMLHALLKKWNIRVGWPLVLYGCYLAFGAATVLFSSDRVGGIRTTSQVVGNLAFLFLIVNMVRDWRFAKLGVVIWLAASALAGAWTVYNWHFSGGERIVGEASIGTTDMRFKATVDDNSTWDNLEKAVARAQGTTSHPAVFGINMTMTLPFWLYLFRVHRSRVVRAVAVLSLLLCLYNIFLTNTRATIVLAAAILVLAAVRRLVLISPGHLIAALAIGTCSLYVLPEDIWVRVLDVSSYTSGRNTGTFQLRMQFWEAAWEGIQRSPLVGNGLGNQTVVPELIRGVSPKRISAHNEYMNTLLEVGLIGWMLMFGTVYLLVRSSFRAATMFRGAPGFQEQYWFMVAAQLTLFSVLLDGLQVDVFHFPLKGWWFVAALCWSLEIWAREATRARGTPP